MQDFLSVSDHFGTCCVKVLTFSGEDKAGFKLNMRF